jgi:hypothetical protein
MTVLENPDYQNARGRIKGNPVISMMAAGVAAVPLAQIAHEDGAPRFAFMQQSNHAFDDAEARNAGNPAYEPYPPDAHRHPGLIAEAVLAERAAIRDTVASAVAAPGTGPESGSLSSQRVELLVTIFGPTRDGRIHDLDLGRPAGLGSVAPRPAAGAADQRQQVAAGAGRVAAGA